MWIIPNTIGIYCIFFLIFFYIFSVCFTYPNSQKKIKVLKTLRTDDDRWVISHISELHYINIHIF